MGEDNKGDEQKKKKNAVRRVDNDMPCHRTGYDKHNIHAPATQTH